MTVNKALVVLLVAAIQQCVCACAVTSDSPVFTQLTQPVIHAEGPHWDADKNVLYFVDISGHKLYQWEAATDRLTYVDVGGAIGFAIPVETEHGGRFIAGRDHDLVLIDWTGKRNVTLKIKDQQVLASVDNEAGKTGNRWNDGKADAAGRLWAGTLGAEVKGVLDRKKGSLYSLDPHRKRPLNQLQAVDISNGIAWTEDNSVMYYIDTPTRRVDAFDFDVEQGVICNRRTVFDMAEFEVIKGSPDGMTIDSDGNLWIALYGGYAVIKVDPFTGKLLQQLGLPVGQVTSVIFGGHDLETLFITTSRRGLSKVLRAQQPTAGSVFAVEGLGVRGLPGYNVRREMGDYKEWINY